MSNLLHYQGLAAEVYDDWHKEPLPDRDFYRRWIEEDGRPALEVASGTGRLLLEYLAAGLEVEGLDASPDMVAICRRKAEERGLDLVLHETLMQEMDLGKRYGTIYVPFRTFMVLTDRDVVLEALRRFREHLDEGGKLFISLFVPSYPITVEQKGRWTVGGRFERADGSVVMISESVTNDLVEQLKTVRFRIDIYEDRVLTRTELQEFRMRWYFKYEFALLLEKAGFRDVFAHGDYTDEEVRSGQGEMTFRATR
jgi:SAM-dependent methyltransferase